MSDEPENKTEKKIASFEFEAAMDVCYDIMVELLSQADKIEEKMETASEEEKASLARKVEILHNRARIYSREGRRVKWGDVEAYNRTERYHTHYLKELYDETFKRPFHYDGKQGSQRKPEPL